MKKERIKNIFLLISGIILTSIAFTQFTLPNKIVGGGVSGISTLLYHSFGIQPGLSSAVINITLLLSGLKVLGKHFIISTGAASLLLSGLVQVFSLFPPITDDVALASLFGGIMYGVGVGLALVSGGSSGGTDIMGRLLQHRFSHLPIGRLIMFADAVVIFFSFIAFGKTELTLYGVITLFISSYTVDLLIRKLNVSKLAFVVSDKGEEIAQSLVSTSHRGVTVVDTVGAYRKKSNKMLVCALKDNELCEFQRKILEIDRSAFIIFSESSQIVGNGFHVYR